MNNDTINEVYNASHKSNILNILSTGIIQNLSETEITRCGLSSEEFKHQHKICLPPTIEKSWEKYGSVEFSNFFSEHSYNNLSTVKKFCFSPEKQHFRLYNDLKHMVPEHSKAQFSDLKEIIHRCIKTYGELQEVYENEFHVEIFFFDSIGNIDSIRFSGSNYETPITEFIQSILNNKDKYLNYIQQLNKATEQEIEIANQKVADLKHQHPVIGPYVHKIPDYLEGIHERLEYFTDDKWTIHEGDLIVDGNWKADEICKRSECLLITGNLHVKGTYDGYRNTFSWVVVLGDMTANDVICWYGLTVIRNLSVKGIVYVEHYVFPLELGGDLRARYLYDLTENTRWKNEYIDIYDDADIIKNISPELLAGSIIERELSSDFSATADCLLAGGSAFRHTPLSDEIVNKFLRYTDEDIEDQHSQEELIADMQLDALLAIVIAVYQDVKKENLFHLEAYRGLHGKHFDKAIQRALENQI